MLFKKEEKQDHQATVMHYPPNVHIAFQAFCVARKRVYLTSNEERLLTFRHAVDGICEQKKVGSGRVYKGTFAIRQDVFFSVWIGSLRRLSHQCIVESKETFRNILIVLNRHWEVYIATTPEMASYLDCLNPKRNAERECPTSVLQMTGCPSKYF